jgi:hypothetical protein
MIHLAFALLALSWQSTQASDLKLAARAYSDLLSLVDSTGRSHPDAFVFNSPFSAWIDLPYGEFGVTNGAGAGITIDRATGWIVTLSTSQVARPQSFDSKQAKTVSPEDASAIALSIFDSRLVSPYRGYITGIKASPESYDCDLAIRQGDLLLGGTYGYRIRIDSYSGYPIQISDLPLGKLPQIDMAHSHPEFNVRDVEPLAASALASTVPWFQGRIVRSEFVAAVPTSLQSPTSELDEVQLANAKSGATMVFHLMVLMGVDSRGHEWEMLVYTDGSTGRPTSIVQLDISSFGIARRSPPFDPSKPFDLLGTKRVAIAKLTPSTRVLSKGCFRCAIQQDKTIRSCFVDAPSKLVRIDGKVYQVTADDPKALQALKGSSPLKAKSIVKPAG